MHQRQRGGHAIASAVVVCTRSCPVASCHEPPLTHSHPIARYDLATAQSSHCRLLANPFRRSASTLAHRSFGRLIAHRRSVVMSDGEPQSKKPEGSSTTTASGVHDRYDTAAPMQTMRMRRTMLTRLIFYVHASDSDFQQQRLKAWQPLLTPKWVSTLADPRGR
jgi:hypothetical protein